MHTIESVVCNIKQVRREKNSANGNPRYWVSLIKDGYIFATGKTAIDAGWVYGVDFDSLEGKLVHVLMRKDNRTTNYKIEMIKEL